MQYLVYTALGTPEPETILQCDRKFQWSQVLRGFKVLLENTIMPQCDRKYEYASRKLINKSQRSRLFVVPWPCCRYPNTK